MSISSDGRTPVRRRKEVGGVLDTVGEAVGEVVVVGVVVGVAFLGGGVISAVISAVISVGVVVTVVRGGGFHVLANGVKMVVRRRAGVAALERVAVSGLLGAAMLIAGRRRALRRRELLAELAYSCSGDRPSPWAARVLHAAGFVVAAVKMRLRDIRNSRIANLGGHVARPGVPSLVTALVLATHFYVSGGFAAIIGHLEAIKAVIGLVGLIEIVVRGYRRHLG